MLSLIFIILAFAIVYKSIKVVPLGSSFVVYRLGRFDRKIGPGLHLLLPFIDQCLLDSDSDPQPQVAKDRFDTKDRF